MSKRKAWTLWVRWDKNDPFVPYFTIQPKWCSWNGFELCVLIRNLFAEDNKPQTKILPEGRKPRGAK